MEYSKIDELERLAKAATPRPWIVTGKGCPEYVTDANPNRKIARILRTPRAWEENSAYIVAACNAAPELIAENRALQERVRELERQRVYLAKLLGDLCTAQKDGQCPLFYACPASGFGWSCGNAIKEDWVYAAIQAAKEAGE